MEGTGQHRNLLGTALLDLEHDLLEMGSIAESMVGQAIESLCNQDVDQAMRVLKSDDEVDIRDLEIESQCLRMLALQQPIASDLRTIGTAMKMITDIERVGDLAVDIARAGMKIERELGRTDYVDLRKMSNVARSMFRDALQSFVKKDMELVHAVCQRDDEVDELYRINRKQIHDFMRSNQDEVVGASWLLLVVHHLERIADHSVNIAERVAFVVTGKLEQLVESHSSSSLGTD